jgi:hypothetical protein
MANPTASMAGSLQEVLPHGPDGESNHISLGNLKLSEHQVTVFRLPFSGYRLSLPTVFAQRPCIPCSRNFLPNSMPIAKRCAAKFAALFPDDDAGFLGPI